MSKEKYYDEADILRFEKERQAILKEIEELFSIVPWYTPEQIERGEHLEEGEKIWKEGGEDE